MNLSFKKLATLAVLVELLIFLFCYTTTDSSQELFRFAARYSGRFSLVIFLITFYLYSTYQKKSISKDSPLKNFLKLFAIVHVIHFGFLATNIYLNEIQLEIPKVIGGALAYLMIVIAPFKFDKISRKFQILYFYYVSFIMIMTYVSRIKGDFEGAQPFWFHYVAITILIISTLLFGFKIFKSKQ